MADIHLTRELLRAVSRGELPASVISQIGMKHLMNLCPTCRREISDFQKEQRVTPAAHYRRAFELLPALLEQRIPGLEREHLEAVRDLKSLLALEREERIRKVERAQRRFRSGALARLLISKGRKQVHIDPEEACHLAALARLIAHRNPQMPGSFDVIALATAHIANARRAGSDLRQAEEHFGHARYVINQYGVTDTEVLAEIDHLEGSLRMDQRRFEDSEELLTRAAMLYRMSGNRTGTAGALITLGGLYLFRDQIAQAIEVTTAALEELKDSREPRLILCARYNLVRCLTEDGRYLEAAEMLSADEDLYRGFPDAWTQLRLLWIRGKIAAGRGEIDTAEQAFLQVRDGFIALENGYDAAMVSVEDLAVLYLQEGRTADVKRLAEEMYLIFQAQDVHPEAVAALKLFQEAARQEQLNIKLLREYSRYLQEARIDPSLRFHAE